MLDQQLDTGNYKFESIEFLIPSKDFDGNAKQLKRFVHRNGLNIGTTDDGDRTSLVSIPLNSNSSSNTSIHNYIENTTSGAKIVTSENEDLILEEEVSGSYINGSALNKTFNDYFLSSGILNGIRNGSDRSKIQKNYNLDIYMY